MIDSVRPAAKRRTKIRKRRPRRPRLRLTPYAWAKLRFLRDLGPTEVAMFGISAENDPLLVEDVRLVAQTADMVNVAFGDEAVAEFFDTCVDEGLSPERFARIWIHTHPGDCPEPSFTDEETFERVFGRCDWAVMAILARGDQKYARLRFGVGPGGQLRIPMVVDWEAPFPAAGQPAWKAEYERCVHPNVWPAIEDESTLARLRRIAERNPMTEDHHRDEDQPPFDEYELLLAHAPW